MSTLIGTERLMYLDLAIGQKMFKVGLVDAGIICSYQLYTFVLLTQAQGFNKSTAVIKASEEFNVCERRVWQALQFFR